MTTTPLGGLVISFVSGATLTASQLNAIQYGKMDVSNGQALCPIFTAQDAVTDAVRIRNTAAGTKRTSISYNDDWYWGTDQPGNGDGGYYVYHKATNNLPIKWTGDDQCIIQWSQSQSLTSNAYAGVGGAMQINAYYGRSAPMAGSSATFSVISNVYDVKALPDGTNSEISCVYTYLQPFSSHSQKNIHLIGYDNHLITNITADPTQRPSVQLGMSYLMTPLAAGSELMDGNGQGSFIFSACNRPLSADEITYYGGDPSTGRTYPVTAMYVACGFSGSPAVVDGSYGNADYGAMYAYLAGGGGGSVYNSTQRSRFKVCFGAYDWTDFGIYIGPPTGASSTGGYQVGIQNGYLTVLGGQPYDDSGVMLSILPDQRGTKTHAASMRAAMQIGNQWLIGRDWAMAGGTDLFVAPAGASSPVLQLDTAKIGLFGVTPVTRPGVTALPSSPALSDVVTTLSSLLSGLSALGAVTVH
ncbi:hypothetical protein AA12717_1418 [Gluconacetobacter sacchari DSM 12717]|uniref:Uncharacterized protein n=2 Tax=Gluconacetobacter sacchari TaxID=92759 RepID=A0A7W4IBK9_9PROT|nr:hypothetical protein [Gluconacetobacter sacchari]MBB2159739.1 hypothetical protein [Gluconacetobacter sacchari]GBQ23181.1 hypothetical protein AA12717_1418 [Gluconacetobacter sacchari DSM 12717]